MNEISFVPWGGGDAGFLNPFSKRRGPELKAQPLAGELSHQQQLWQTQRRDHRAVEETVNIHTIDEAAREVDVAATKSRTKRRE